MFNTTDTERAEDAVRLVLRHIDPDPDRSGLEETPARVVRSWRELFSGYDDDPARYFKKFDDSEAYDNMIIFRKLLVQSYCEHHMIPFFGHAWIAYIPQDKGHVIGASKMARVLRVYTRRLQLQERIGQQVVKAINDNLNVKGAACLLRCQHLCMVYRGVKEPEGDMVTSSLSGVFKEDQKVREEFLNLVRM